MTDYELSVRQPAAGDIVGTTIPLAARGTAFEATWAWRLAAGDRTLAEGSYFGGGSAGQMVAFVTELAVGDLTYAGPATFEFHGDTGAENPRTVRIPVIVIPGASGYWPYRVQGGDTLTAIAEKFSDGSGVVTVDNIVAANALTNPDYIETGQLLRIPM